MVHIIFSQSDGSSITVPAETGASLMEAALIAEVTGIDGECGGAGICGTCHVKVDPAWENLLPTPNDAETEMIEALGREAGKTRLACQIIVARALDGLKLEVLGDAT